MNAPASWPSPEAPGDGLIDHLILSPVRLDAVRDSGLLDTPAEEVFDALTRLAARLLDVPVSFVSVVDAGRDFYKSQTGLPDAIAADRQLDGRTLCHYTLNSDQPLVIDDTFSHPVWKSVPTVETMGIRAYAGVPLKLDGQRIGSFCVVDMQPRAWTPDEVETLQQIALSAGRELSLRAALKTAQAEAISAQAQARAKEELIAVVAHDLRTPLQLLYLNTVLLQRVADARHQAIASRMASAIDSMKEMADNLISSSITGTPGARRRDFSGLLLAGEAVEMMRPIAERAGISLVLGDTADATVSVDYAQVLRILGNLIGNAIKYSQAGSVVTVHTRAAPGQLLLTVLDQGKGMTAEEQALAFDRGWQGGAGMVRGDGAGLGLAIVKNLVEMQGGKVSIESEVGRGSAFTVALPCG